MPALPERLRVLQGPIACGILLFVLGAVGVVWLSIAAVESTAAMLGPVWAPALIGLTLLAPLGVFTIMAWMNAPRRQAAPRLAADAAETALATIAVTAHGLIEKSPLAALGLATLAGITATRYPTGLSLLAKVLSASDRA